MRSRAAVLERRVRAGPRLPQRLPRPRTVHSRRVRLRFGILGAGLLFDKGREWAPRRSGRWRAWLLGENRPGRLPAPSYDESCPASRLALPHHKRSVVAAMSRLFCRTVSCHAVRWGLTCICLRRQPEPTGYPRIYIYDLPARFSAYPAAIYGPRMDYARHDGSTWLHAFYRSRHRTVRAENWGDALSGGGLLPLRCQIARKSELGSHHG